MEAERSATTWWSCMRTVKICPTLAFLIPILALTLTIPMGVRKKMKLDFSFEMVPVSNTCALDPLVANWPMRY